MAGFHDAEKIEADVINHMPDSSFAVKRPSCQLITVTYESNTTPQSRIVTRPRQTEKVENVNSAAVKISANIVKNVDPLTK